jgi:hypothetical protein
MMLSVLYAADGGPAMLFAEYEALTADPPGQARRLAVFLDRSARPPAATQPLCGWPGFVSLDSGATATGTAKRE